MKHHKKLQMHLLDDGYYLKICLPKIVNETLSSNKFGADAFIPHVMSQQKYVLIGLQDEENREDSLNMARAIKKTSEVILEKKFSKQALLDDKRNVLGDGTYKYQEHPKNFGNGLIVYHQDELKNMIEKYDALINQFSENGEEDGVINQIKSKQNLECVLA